MTALRPGALLLDYGNVISFGQPESDVAAMAQLCRLEPAEFRRRYWALRPGYDRGTSPGAYWSAVVGRPVEDGALSELARIDVEAWLHFNPDVLAILDAAHERGYALSLLSNCPHDLAARLADESALAAFEHRFFSAELGIIKPEPAVFLTVLERMGRRAGDVLFVDDRPDNVDAARSLGMEGLLFSSAEELRGRLLG